MHKTSRGTGSAREDEILGRPAIRPMLVPACRRAGVGESKCHVLEEHESTAAASSAVCRPRDRRVVQRFPGAVVTVNWKAPNGLNIYRRPVRSVINPRSERRARLGNA